MANVRKIGKEINGVAVYRVVGAGMTKDQRTHPYYLGRKDEDGAIVGAFIDALNQHPIYRTSAAARAALYEKTGTKPPAKRVKPEYIQFIGREVGVSVERYVIGTRVQATDFMPPTEGSAIEHYFGVCDPSDKIGPMFYNTPDTIRIPHAHWLKEAKEVRRKINQLKAQMKRLQAKESEMLKYAWQNGEKWEPPA